MKPNNIRTNSNIHAKNIIVLDEAGVKLGMFDNAIAVNMASERGLDLIEISFDKNKNEAVCRIADYGKFMFEKKKKEKQQGKIQRENAIQVKEIQLRPTTDDNDLKIKARKASEFLTDGERVRVVMRLRHRELSHKDVGMLAMKNFLTNLEPDSVEKHPHFEGNNLVVILFKGR